MSHVRLAASYVSTKPCFPPALPAASPAGIGGSLEQSRRGKREMGGGLCMLGGAGRQPVQELEGVTQVRAAKAGSICAEACVRLYLY